MRRANVPPQLLTGPFTSATAARYGVSANALKGSSWRRLHRNVWIAADRELDRATWLAAARLALPVDAVLCGSSALDDAGVDVRPRNDVTVHAAFEERVPRARPNMSLRRLQLAPDEVIRRPPWLVTTPLRTAFDCARWLPTVEAVVAVDALAAAGLIDLDELLVFAAAHPGVRWVTRVAPVAEAADRGSESPMESRVRLRMIAAGLPRPVTQYEVFGPLGRFVARLDLAYPELKIAVEYDGAWHWERRRDDDRRRDAVRALGWTVIVVSASDLSSGDYSFIAQVRAAIQRAAA